MRRVFAFIRLSRFYFLPMSMLTYLLGVTVAERERGNLDMQRLFAGLAIQLLVQLSVSYTNDYCPLCQNGCNNFAPKFRVESGGGAKEQKHVSIKW